MTGIMSKMRFSSSHHPLENNPIIQYFEVGNVCSTAGPNLIWRIYDAYRKSDGKECSVFVFDKRVADKLYRPKRKETMVDRIKAGILQMERMRHPKMLQIIHSVEEGRNTIAFASESIMSTLHHIMAWHESTVGSGVVTMVTRDDDPQLSVAGQSKVPTGTPNSSVSQCPPFAKEYYFLDIELRFGLLQIVEALNYLHYTVHQMHRNVSPQVILITKRGTWKLFGLEFVEDIIGPDPTDTVPALPWSIKTARIVQPNLDYMAPEIQINAHSSILSDMFSLGLIICTIFNNGRSVIQSYGNPMLYMKQIEILDKILDDVMPQIPPPLQEAVQRLLTLDPHPRPTTQLLPLIKYFKCSSEPAIHAMQFLDVITMKDRTQKANFFRGTLIDALPGIPKVKDLEYLVSQPYSILRVSLEPRKGNKKAKMLAARQFDMKPCANQKLLWQHVWPVIKMEVKTAEVLASALQPVIWITNVSTEEEFAQYILPTLKNLLHSPRTVQATVTILENLHIIIKKCQRHDINKELLPLLFNALDSNTHQIQTASLIAMQCVSEYVDDKALHTIVLPKVKILLEKNQSDVKIISLILGIYEKVLLRLERSHILEQVIPTLLGMRLSDPDIINRVVRLYKAMLMEKKFGLTTNILATKMIPSLAPQTVNPALNVDQFSNLIEILYDMLENIDKNQRHKLKLENISLHSPERYRSLRQQTSTDNVTAPPFAIPNLRVDHRKTSSAEDMARKNSVSAPRGASSIGGFRNSQFGNWFLGSNNSTNNDSNFLRVASIFPGRRLSDNTLMTPKIRIAPSCASSPGGTPGGTSGLPTRRHSSIGPQERRGSTVNLSPPTGYQYRGRGGSGSSLSVPSTSQCGGGSMPNTSSSVPFLLTSSMQSIRSRRPSAGSSQGSGLLQQISSGVYQLFSGRS